MTKDWDAVQEEIKNLSWVQKKRLDEVRGIMEREFNFKASVRAYRMKLREWGYTTRKGFGGPKTKKRKFRQEEEGEEEEEEDGSDSDDTAAGRSRGDDASRNAAGTPDNTMNLETELLGRATLSVDADGEPDGTAVALESSEDLFPPDACVVEARLNGDTGASSSVEATDVVMDMLAAVLEGDSQKLETLLMQHPNHLNLPIGHPFEIPGGRFYNHPAMNDCAVLQHPGQTLLDIACALPTGPSMWVLLAHGAKGSKHPLGTDLALHNAIKNGRIYTTQALLLPNRSKVNGEPGTMWKPILQAVYWNQPAIVRLLIDKGASVNETSPWVDGSLKNALLHCTERRHKDFLSPSIREDCNKTLKLLLNAGADIHAKPGGEESPTVFETFLRPWQGDPHWISKLSTNEMDCLEAFIRKGADLKTPFMGFICGAQSYNHFQHQLLWHTTPATARLLVDHAVPTPEGNGRTLLHEIVGSCPDAKRHPSDTLRDIEVLLSRGADPNLLDEPMFSPLRRCIETCPAVDIIPRLRLLLDGGADPELKHSNRLPPYVLAARTFEEPLRSQIMDFLVAKMKGRQPRVVYDDTFTWTPGYFPIPSEPSWEQLQLYSSQNGDFNANIDRMIPEDIRAVFQRSCFSVASVNFLNASTLRVKMAHPLPPTVLQTDEIYQAVLQRQASGLPVYTFDQDFVMLVLKPHMPPVLPAFPTSVAAPATSTGAFVLPDQPPTSSTAQNQPSAPAPLSPFRFNTSSTSSTSNNTHRSRSPANDPAIVPETTLIRMRWPSDPREKAKLQGPRKVKDDVLKYRCEECGTGNLLTKREFERHGVEHEHSRWCVEPRCKRRFCVQKREV